MPGVATTRLLVSRVPKVPGQVICDLKLLSNNNNDVYWGIILRKKLLLANSNFQTFDDD